MPINNFSLSDLTRRIIINLPVKFNAEEGTNVYKFFEAIADGFQLTSTQVDELSMQTNLVTATGVYVDSYISGLANMGRYASGIVYVDGDESDANYKQRYKHVIYKHNSTKPGIQQIFIDFFGNTPKDMYTGKRDGAFANIESFFNSGNQALWGSNTSLSYTGYIELYREPEAWYLDQLLVALRKAVGFGIDLFIIYPQNDDYYAAELTVDFTEGVLGLMETY
jgi:hypothetical protein